ncbi:MAG: TraC family protein [Patescibacteria group bacterium]|nr:TraC family protein [Patescibacteria group bacterium]
MNKVKDPQKTSMYKGKNSSEASTQKHLLFGEIKKNTIVMKDGSLRAVLRISSVNFSLKSEDEQNAIIYGYQDFLNSLEFPVQILIRSRKLSIDNYIGNIEKHAQKQQNALLKKQTYEYLEYIRKLIDLADIMKKNFYLVVTYDPPQVTGKTFIQKFLESLRPGDNMEELRNRWKNFEASRKALQRRVVACKSALANCRLQSEQLTTQELIELFYEFYNPLTAREEKITNLSNMNLIGGDDADSKNSLDNVENDEEPSA